LDITLIKVYHVKSRLLRKEGPPALRVTIRIKIAPGVRGWPVHHVALEEET
jgi:hypothetical protein